MPEMQVRALGPLTVVIDSDAFADLCHDRDLVTDVRVAQALGVDRSVATRLRRGEQRPGIPLLCGLLTLLGEDLPAPLQIVPDRSPHRRAAWQRLREQCA